MMSDAKAEAETIKRERGSEVGASRQGIKQEGKVTNVKAGGDSM